MKTIKLKFAGDIYGNVIDNEIESELQEVDDVLFDEDDYEWRQHEILSYHPTYTTYFEEQYNEQNYEEFI